MKNKSIFWGLSLILIAGLIILRSIGTAQIAEFSTAAIIISIFIFVLVVSSLFKKEFFFAFAVMGAGYYFIYSDYLFKEYQIGYIKWYYILIAILLLGIGFEIIFGKPKNNSWVHWDKCNYDRDANSEHIDGEYIECRCRFGGCTKYIDSKNLKRGIISCSFGGVELYLTDAELSPEGAVIDLNVSFGGVEIYIPKSWRVENNLKAILGGVTKKNNPKDSETPVLTLNGEVILGGIEIVYV